MNIEIFDQSVAYQFAFKKILRSHAWDLPCVGVVLLGVVGFVENEEIDLLHCDEGMFYALV